jgi:hypothetical protein
MKTPAHKFKILFLCTWNSRRSIFAEYFMKDIGVGGFEAFSAGVTPKGQVSPITLKGLQDNVLAPAHDNDLVSERQAQALDLWAEPATAPARARPKVAITMCDIVASIDTIETHRHCTIRCSPSTQS